MSLPCVDCFVFSLCKSRYQNTNVIFCDLLHEAVFDSAWKDEQWFQLHHIFSNSKIEMVALERLEKHEGGTIGYRVRPKSAK